MIKIALSILIAFALGFSITCLLWPRQRQLLRDLPVILSLSVGLGFGITSLLYFLWLMVFEPPQAAWISCEIGLVLILSMLAITVRRRHPQDWQTVTTHISRPKSKMEWITAASFLFSLLVAAKAFLWFVRGGIQGGWDAWGIWNLRARFLFLGGEHWQDAFSTEGALSHTDYPLLIPASVARAWSYAGATLPLIPILIGFLFTAASAVLLFSSLSILRSRAQGYLAATVLVASPFFLVLGTAQYADVPLSFFVLATLVLLCLHETTVVHNNHLLVLAGTTIGLAAWTKNEGGLFLACIFLAHAGTAFRKYGARLYLQQLIFLVAGLAPVLMLLAYFKFNFGGHNDLSSPLLTALKMLGRISRWRTVAKAFADQGLRFGGWTLTMTPLLALYILLAGVKRPMNSGEKICLRALCLMVAGYFLVYVVAPVPLDWLLETSLNRVLIQVWPGTLFAIFLITNRVDQRNSEIEQVTHNH